MNSEEESSSIYLLSGSAIHKYVLEHKDFYSEYIVEPRDKPRSSNMKRFCFLRSQGVSANEAQRKSYTKESAVEAASLEETFKGYIEFLKTSKGKIPIPEHVMTSCINISRNIELNRKANDLMYYDDIEEDVETHNEMEFYFKLYGVDFKSKLDRLRINHTTKVIQIIDLKTYTLRSMEEKRRERLYSKFIQSKMYRQFYAYKMAVMDYMSTKFPDSFEEYTYEYKIVYASSNFFNYIDVVNVDARYIDEDGCDNTVELINRYKINVEYAFDNDSYYYKEGELEFKKD
jgi:hypothetical protein